MMVTCTRGSRSDKKQADTDYILSPKDPLESINPLFRNGKLGHKVMFFLLFP